MIKPLAVIKPFAVMMLCASVLTTGCSFISGGTGSSPVGTESGARSLGQVFIDSSIERTAKINLYKLDSRFKQSRVNINSFHSNVLLTGQVPDAHLKQLAEDNLRAMSDVKTVHNYITVGPQIGYSTIMQDSTVTANTRGLLLRAPVVSESKVLVHTEDGVLYVMGLLNNPEMTDLNDLLQKVGNVTKIITLVDNVGQTNTRGLAVSGAVAQPAVQTPVAIDPNVDEPSQDAQQ